MKPIIAITASYEEDYAGLKHRYASWVLKAGGIPVVVPFGLGEEEVRELCGITHGLLLSGGSDIDPAHYGEEPLPELGRVTPERDRLELLLVREFAAKDKPIFAICRGHQVLNVALGGSLYQDIHSQCGGLQHNQKAPRSYATHRIRAEENSIVSRIAGASEFRVNSFHHQAVKDAAPGLRITARSEDGIVEAIESENHRFVLGVQWHPEDTAEVDEVSRNLFVKFVAACRI
ncbi:gamma-glutamyl-gamma-aminobutyrate hydrolase family protein [Paenibacillus ginsengarvi]|uniref:Gamma-glutamyl-gamma-aminobutyrate hydrolase family protein n=1 Tax=Paenibacillus ginsengarvi TaxID=400777 RepID=A0A3B0BT01_9BACL|nr:gamma-glutamyl-gamma-aminobutyrate hydrolase family protein [Paenibacillus ginsengarvi]RKN75980.1 gamma-glutamyl-gamma-aminobutyrate hydrolase family protein [Paenibacillus ginsengarvi]